LRYVKFVAAVALFSAGPLLAHPHPTAETQAGTPDKVVCRHIRETGSLVKKTRTCKSLKEWRLQSDAQRRATEQEMNDRLVNSERGY
jgi:hypothetical protein